MTRALGIVLGLAFVVGCGGTKVPMHSGYKKPKSKPWEKPKVLKLEKGEAKADVDLDYATYKRAKWLAVDLPGPGTLGVQMDVSPNSGTGGVSEDGEELDIDVAMEVLDGASWKVLAKSDLESDDAHELKKEIKVPELAEGRYYIHLYLQGRLDAADVDVKVGYERTTPPTIAENWAMVAFVDGLAAIPPLDDGPEAKPPGGGGGGHGPRPPRPPRPPTPPTPPTPGSGSIVAEITDVQPNGDGAKITIGGGTSDGLVDGLKGSIKGVRNSGFTLTGCGPSTCRATVRAPVEDVRGASGVTIKLK